MMDPLPTQSRCPIHWYPDDDHAVPADVRALASEEHAWRDSR